MRIHIGFDDTDSPRKGCTTYVAALIIGKIRNMNVNFLDFPNLIRLNPNVPWKTRGNGALCIRIESKESKLNDIQKCVVNTIEENADLDYEGTDPGVVFLFGELPPEIRTYSKNAIRGQVSKVTAMKLIKRFKAEAIGFKRGRGIIGGLAAIGEDLVQDHTFELIAYRVIENRGTPRRIDTSSVRFMDEKTNTSTFNNIDPDTGRILITPRGPDPILYGIRGETHEDVRNAHRLIVSYEPIERWLIFRTNHGTDAHLDMTNSIIDIKPYNPVTVIGKVAKEPVILRGGHVFFDIQDGNGQITCAAYKPTAGLRNAARELILGDLIEASGGVRPASETNPITLNLEKMRVLKLESSPIYFNPICPCCGKRMKSMGHDQGFRCDNCGFRGSKMQKLRAEKKRLIQTGIYLPPPRSQRHLTKPLCRYGKEKPMRTTESFNPIPYNEFYYG